MNLIIFILYNIYILLSNNLFITFILLLDNLIIYAIKNKISILSNLSLINVEFVLIIIFYINYYPLFYSLFYSLFYPLFYSLFHLSIYFNFNLLY